jgi:integrase
MADLYKQPETRFWTGVFYDANGKRHRKSTGMEDEEKARQILDGWKRAAGTAIHTASQARKVTQEILKPHLESDKASLTVRGYVERYLDLVSVSASSKATYTSTLHCFVDELGPVADAPVHALGLEHVAAWRDAELTRRGPRTVYNKLKQVRMMLHSAKREGFVMENVAQAVKCNTKAAPAAAGPDGYLAELAADLAADTGTAAPAAPEGAAPGKHRRPFTLPELLRLESVLPDDWKMILWTGFYTGQRLTDVVTLRWDAINFDTAKIRLITRKTDTRIAQPIAPPLAEMLARWRATQPADARRVFPAQAALLLKAKGMVHGLSKRFAHFLWLADLRPYSPFSRSRAKERERKAANAAAVAAGRKPPSHFARRNNMELCFHSLRHTARTVLVEAGIPEAVIDEYIGHEGETGSLYTHVGKVGNDSLKRASAALADFAAKKLRGATVLRVLPPSKTRAAS